MSAHFRRAAKAGVPGFEKFLKPHKKPPDRLAYLLAWYTDIRGQQARGMYVEPLSHQEIRAWRENFDVALKPWEVDVLVRLDKVWLSCVPKPGGK